jgi:tetratricopeptide (TPR) repeat protein
MAKKLTVFLSSTGADLADYRAAVLERLRASDYIHCDGMETFGARDSSPEDFCRKRAQDCDVFVGLIGHYRGSDVPGDNQQRSFTEMEYAAATDSKKPRLMYIVPDDFHPPAPAQTNKAARQQAAFRKQVLSSRVVSKNFETPDRLAGAVAVDLMNLLVEKVAGEIAATSGTAVPGQAQAVTEAVAAVAEGAQQGDDRMARALALLEEKKTEEAAQLLRVVAEEKTAQVERDRNRIAQDSKAAAAAWRHLGAIAGLADPMRALDGYLKATELEPGDVLSQFWVGWFQLQRGFLDDAGQRFDRVLALVEDDNDWRRYWARLGHGDIEMSHGDLEKALRQYRTAEEIADRRAKANPADTGRQRDLSVSYSKVGDVLVAQGKLDDALTTFRDCLAIRQRLAKADPANPGGQRDLSVPYDRIGNVLEAQGKLDDALTAFRDSLAIRERLAKADPANALWQRDLSVAYDRVGGVLAAQGKRDDAITAFRDSLAIKERLAKADPANAQGQVDLLWAHWRLAERGDDPASRWDLVVKGLRKLKAENRLTAEQARWLPEAERRLQAVKSG